jgi:hypothetical protein
MYQTLYWRRYFDVLRLRDCACLRQPILAQDLIRRKILP